MEELTGKEKEDIQEELNNMASDVWVSDDFVKNYVTIDELNRVESNINNLEGNLSNNSTIIKANSDSFYENHVRINGVEENFEYIKERIDRTDNNIFNTNLFSAVLFVVFIISMIM